MYFQFLLGLAGTILGATKFMDLLEAERFENYFLEFPWEIDFGVILGNSVIS